MAEELEARREAAAGATQRASLVYTQLLGDVHGVDRGHQALADAAGGLWGPQRDRVGSPGVC